MKIALVYDYLNQLGGAEKVLRAFHEIYPKAPVFTLFYDREKLKGAFDDLEIHESKLPRFLIKRHKYLLPFLPTAVEQFDLSGFDAVISITSAYGKGVLTKPEIPHICYCNTPTRFLWDWHHSYLEEQKLGKIKKSVVIPTLSYLRIWDRLAANRVDYFIATSENVARRIQKYYRAEPDAIIYPPIDISKFKVEKTHEDYFLIVSRLSPYKKIDLAVQAFNKLGLPLVIVGEGSQKDYLESIAGKNIEFVGFKPDEVIREYYSNCRAFIFPTFDEDFGLTPIEAAASGRPVIAAGKGGTRETVIEGVTGEFFDEPTPESLISAVNKFIKKEKQYNPKEIRVQAEKFDKEIFKKKIKDFVDWAVEDYKEKINKV